MRTWGTFTDLSIRGCYIEMTATFPVGARVDLSLELNGIRAETQGEVRVSYPFLGMGDCLPGDDGREPGALAGDGPLAVADGTYIGSFVGRCDPESRYPATGYCEPPPQRYRRS